MSKFSGNNQFSGLSLNERFFQKVEITDSCWNWIGALNSGGYGWVGYLGKTISTHRLSWILHYGDIPDGMMVLHKCDNRKCVNPDHLFLGTQDDNMKDAKKKGRNSRGTGIWTAKLSEDDIKEIRHQYHNGKTKEELSDSFNVSRPEIYKIVNGLIWTFVE